MNKFENLDPLGQLFQKEPSVASELGQQMVAVLNAHKQCTPLTIRMMEDEIGKLLALRPELPPASPSLIAMSNGKDTITTLMIVWHTEPIWPHHGECDAYLGMIGENSLSHKRTELYACVESDTVHVRWGGEPHDYLSCRFEEIVNLHPGRDQVALHFMTAFQLVRNRPELRQVKPALLQ